MVCAICYFLVAITLHLSKHLSLAARTLLPLLVFFFLFSQCICTDSLPSHLIFLFLYFLILQGLQMTNVLFECLGFGMKTSDNIVVNKHIAYLLFFDDQLSSSSKASSSAIQKFVVPSPLSIILLTHFTDKNLCGRMLSLKENVTL